MCRQSYFNENSQPHPLPPVPPRRPAMVRLDERSAEIPVRAVRVEMGEKNMSRHQDLSERLKDVLKTVKKQRSRDTVESAIWELENSLGYSDGVWVVRENGSHLSKFAELSDIESLDIKELAACEMVRDRMAGAISQAIEETRREMPNGETWWTYCPHDVVSAMFEVLLEKEK